MKTSSLRSRILLPTMLAILILLGVFAATALWLQEGEINREFETKIESVEELFATLLDSNVSMMGAALNVVMRDKELMTAFRNRNRELLYKQSEALFNSCVRDMA